MTEGRTKRQWTQLGGNPRVERTDDDLEVADGSAEYLGGRLQERYGIVRDEAQRQIRDFEA